MLKVVSSANKWWALLRLTLLLEVVDNQLIGILQVVWEINIAQGTILVQQGTGHIVSSAPLHHWVFGLSPLRTLHKGGPLQDDQSSACVQCSNALTIYPVDKVCGWLKGWQVGVLMLLYLGPNTDLFDWAKSSGYYSLPLLRPLWCSFMRPDHGFRVLSAVWWSMRPQILYIPLQLDKLWHSSHATLFLQLLSLIGLLNQILLRDYELYDTDEVKRSSKMLNILQK